MDSKKIRIGKVAEILGVSIQTLRNWEKAKKIQSERSFGGQRYYLLKDIKHFAINLQKLGWAWAASAQTPEIPDEYYCERHDRFTSRLEKMGTVFIKANLKEDIISLLIAVVGEIGDNSFMHNVGNWPDTPGIFFAYDIDKRIVVLADRGQGIRKTLFRVRPTIKTDIEALRIAFTEIISGREPEKRGNGLKVVKKIVESNSIGLLFHSGLAIAESSKEPSLLKIKVASYNVRGVYAVIAF